MGFQRVDPTKGLSTHSVLSYGAPAVSPESTAILLEDRFNLVYGLSKLCDVRDCDGFICHLYFLCLVCNRPLMIACLLNRLIISSFIRENFFFFFCRENFNMEEPSLIKSLLRHHTHPRPV